jgi:hypothetical protein
MRILIVIFLGSILQASSCRREHGECPATFLNKNDDRLTIVNRSAEKLTFVLSYDYPGDSLRLASYVPGELVVNTNPEINVGPNSSRKVSVNSCWESRFPDFIPSGKLRIMIFNIDSVKAYPPAEIISRGLYKSYLYTLDELKALDWQVVYP